MKLKLFTLLFMLSAMACKAQEVVYEEEEFPIYEIVGNDTIYLVVEEQPIFPDGGLNKLFEYLGNKLVYPEIVINKGIEGRFIVNFIIDTDGKMRNYTIQKSLHPDLDNEVIRVLKSVPHRWTPGRHNGKTVKVKYTLPINIYP